MLGKYFKYLVIKYSPVCNVSMFQSVDQIGVRWSVGGEDSLQTERFKGTRR